MTKDQHSLEQTIETMKVADMRLNTISLCGWTEAIKVVLSIVRDLFKS